MITITWELINKKMKHKQKGKQKLDNKAFKVVTFNILALSLYIIGLFLGFIQPLYQNDASHLTYLLTFLMLFNVGASIYDSFRPTNWIDKYLVFFDEEFLFIGLIGTLVGLTLMIISIKNHGIQADQLDGLIKDFIAGLSSMFNATLFGIVCFVWTHRIVYFKRDQ